MNAELDKQADRVTVVYKVDRGSRHRVSDVRFAGNKFFTREQLAAHVIVEKGKYFNRRRLSRDLLKKSVESLTALYRNEGFTKAKVAPEVAEHDVNIEVTFHIDEGPQDRVHDLKIVDRNNQPVRLKIGRRPLQLAVGKPYSPHLLQGDRNYILAQYLNRGYPNVQFDSSVAAAEGDPNGFDVVYKVDEGTLVKIGKWSC